MANFYCKFCGQKFPSVHALTCGACSKHPDGRGKHELYEGSEKSEYTCKYCGRKFSSIHNMTNNPCPKHPDGPNRGRHSPAL